MILRGLQAVSISPTTVLMVFVLVVYLAVQVAKWWRK